MKTRLLIAVLLCCISLPSCYLKANDIAVHTEIPERPYIDSIGIEDWELMKELYAAWSVDGNPDYFENAIRYDLKDAKGVLAFELQDCYTLKDEVWKLGVHPTTELQIADYSHRVNLEKWESGQWVRQCIFWNAKTYSQTAHQYALHDVELGMPYQMTISERDFEIDVSSIYQRPEVGRYRFVFYIAIKNGEDVENRMYYIPFEVVE